MEPQPLAGVTVITCTNRSHQFEEILANYQRQRYRKKELIIILNKDDMPLSFYRKKVQGTNHISVYKKAAAVSLGNCLNFGVRQARYPVIAKFDDDDYYSPYYLAEQMKALNRTGAEIVGKLSHLKYLEGKRMVIMTAPEQSRKFVGFLAGGTIMFRKSITRNARFPDLTLGEDIIFLNRCKRKGYRLYATSPYNFVGIRRKNKQSHTWNEPDDNLLKGSSVVLKSGDYKRIAIRPV